MSASHQRISHIHSISGAVSIVAHIFNAISKFFPYSFAVNATGEFYAQMSTAQCTHSNENEQKSELTSTQWPMININFHIPERCSLLKCIPRLRFCYSRNCVCFSSVTFIGQSKLYNGWKFSTNSNKTRWERFKHSVVPRLLQSRIWKLKVKDSLVALHFHLNHKLKLAYGKTSFCEWNKQHFMRLVGEGNEQVSEMDRVIEKCTIRGEKAPTNANNS